MNTVETELLARRCAKEGRVKDAIDLALQVHRETGQCKVMSFLADLHLQSKQFDEALVWVKKAIDAGDSEARYKLADIVFQNTIAGDSFESRPGYDAAHFVPDVMRYVGDLFLHNGEKNTAVRWYRRAVAGNCESAKPRLIALLLEMADVTHQETKEQLYDEAARLGSAEANYKLGLLFKKAGDSLAADQYLMMAADLGHRRAKDDLTRRGYLFDELSALGQPLVACPVCGKKVAKDCLRMHKMNSCGDFLLPGITRYENFSNRNYRR